MDNFEKGLFQLRQVMVIFDEEEVAHDGEQHPRECYASTYLGLEEWWHVKAPVAWDQLSQQQQQTFQVRGFKMTGITWETFKTARDKPKENAKDSDRALVNFLFAVRREWNYPREYPLIVGHKRGREDEKLLRLNQDRPGLNASALDLGKITSFPTYDQIVGHPKKEKKGTLSRIRIYRLMTRKMCEISLKQMLVEFFTAELSTSRSSSVHIIGTGTRGTRSSAGASNKRSGILLPSIRIHHCSSIARRLRLPFFGDGRRRSILRWSSISRLSRNIKNKSVLRRRGTSKLSRSKSQLVQLLRSEAESPTAHNSGFVYISRTPFEGESPHTGRIDGAKRRTGNPRFLFDPPEPPGCLPPTCVDLFRQQQNPTLDRNLH